MEFTSFRSRFLKDSLRFDAVEETADAAFDEVTEAPSEGDTPSG